MKVQPGKRTWARIAVLIAVAGSAAFGLYLAYLAWTVNSFSVNQRTFSDYAVVQSTTFNGSEISFDVRWLSPDFVPIKAQLTSVSTDAANSPVCGFDLNTVAAGQIIPMPFSLTQSTPVISDLSLYIAVHSVSTGQEFTIVYSQQNVTAHSGRVYPSYITCSEPNGNM